MAETVRPRHNHVVKDPRAPTAKCGGPALCDECRREQEDALASGLIVRTAGPGPGSAAGGIEFTRPARPEKGDEPFCARCGFTNDEVLTHGCPRKSDVVVSAAPRAPRVAVARSPAAVVQLVTRTEHDNKMIVELLEEAREFFVSEGASAIAIVMLSPDGYDSWKGCGGSGSRLALRGTVLGLQESLNEANFTEFTDSRSPT